MKRAKAILLTAAAVLMFDCCIAVLAGILFRSMCGRMPKPVLSDRPEISGPVIPEVTVTVRQPQ